MTGRLWTCSVCGYEGAWSDEHQWFGSLLDLEGGRFGRTTGRPIVVTCSALCRERAAVLGMVPSDAEVIA